MENYEYNKYYETKASAKAHKIMNIGKIVPTPVLEEVKKDIEKAHKWEDEAGNEGSCMDYSEAWQFTYELELTLREAEEHNKIVRKILYR